MPADYHLPLVTDATPTSWAWIWLINPGEDVIVAEHCTQERIVAYRELEAVVKAVQSCAEAFPGKVVQLHLACDSQVAIAVLEKGYSSLSPELEGLVGSITHLRGVVRIAPRWIPSASNVELLDK